MARVVFYDSMFVGIWLYDAIIRTDEPHVVGIYSDGGANHRAWRS
jgi:hypothetical protein